MRPPLYGIPQVLCRRDRLSAKARGPAVGRADRRRPRRRGHPGLDGAQDLMASPARRPRSGPRLGRDADRRPAQPFLPIPSAVRRWACARARGPCAAGTARSGRAQLAWRSPPRLSRWRWVRPHEAGSGAAPQSRCRTVVDGRRCGRGVARMFVWSAGCWNGGLDPASPQVSADGAAGVGLVTQHPTLAGFVVVPAAAADPDSPDRREKGQRVVPVPGGGDPRDRAAPPVGGQVNLGRSASRGSGRRLP